MLLLLRTGKRVCTLHIFIIYSWTYLQYIDKYNIWLVSHYLTQPVPVKPLTKLKKRHIYWITSNLAILFLLCINLYNMYNYTYIYFQLGPNQFATSVRNSTAAVACAYHCRKCATNIQTVRTSRMNRETDAEKTNAPRTTADALSVASILPSDTTVIAKKDINSPTTVLVKVRLKLSWNIN